ncbi:MAG: chromosomal replication initiator protein DnaA [Chloroflexi bacterium]|nr:chromosomal replication initiator protein DnaA [Chloroflexota bacterium]
MLVDTAAHRLWEAALGRLQLQVTRPSFNTWLRGTVGLNVENDLLTVGVPTTFAAEWLERRMHSLIEEAVSAVASAPVGVTFRVQSGDDLVARSATPSSGSNPTSPSSGYQGSAPRRVTDIQLNPRYTFDSFVVGDNSQLAYAAAMAVADAPGASYNPLFLYGAVGLGKTHLLHAIGHRALEAGKSVAYVTCEQFTNEFLSAIRERKTDTFRARYRAVDLLLLDDIQFIAGKEGTQEGFFHTFNALHDAGRQIVLTCDRPPSALPLLEERLRSRFEWGLLADISAPSLETRTAILGHYAGNSRVEVPTEILDFIAERISGNIRQLEGCLNRITAMAEFTNAPITLELAITALGVTAAQSTGDSTPKTVLESVAAHYGLPTAVLLSSRRDRPVATARQLAMYILNTTYKLSPEEIGNMLGGRDRTTVIYNVKRLTKRMAADTEFAPQSQHLVIKPTTKRQ